MKNSNQLHLDRCPHCGIAVPNLPTNWGTQTAAHDGSNPRVWHVYRCMSCGGMVMTEAPSQPGNADIKQIWPAPRTVADVVPKRARDFLLQAHATMHAPAGAVMLTASAVDAMLKDKGFKDGSLSARIDVAAEKHLITKEMAAWAHEIRLDANDQRHADEGAALPSEADAKKVIEFANALAQFLYVLPARVERGRKG